MFGDDYLTNEQRKKILKETNNKDTINDILEFTDLICELEKIMNKDEDYFTKRISKKELLSMINDKINNIKSFSEINEINEIEQKELYQIYLKICEVEHNMMDIIKIKYNIK